MWPVDLFLPQSWMFWAAVVAIVCISGFFNLLTHLSRNRMLKHIAELGHPVTPELIDSIERLGRRQ